MAEAAARAVLAKAPCDTRAANIAVRDAMGVDKKRANQLLSEAVKMELLARVYLGEFCYYITPGRALDAIGASSGAASADVAYVRFRCRPDQIDALQQTLGQPLHFVDPADSGVFAALVRRDLVRPHARTFGSFMIGGVSVDFA